ncbi:MAG: hypothetical protein JNJ45_05860 [Chthonomonas sp.]|nr:hypothetical protein [Chthonomonas sp.]
MLISDAKEFVGLIVDVAYTNRKGETIHDTAEVFDVNFIPLYGPCLITNIGDIRLDRVKGITEQKDQQQRAA